MIQYDENKSPNVLVPIEYNFGYRDIKNIQRNGNYILFFIQKENWQDIEVFSIDLKQNIHGK